MSRRSWRRCPVPLALAFCALFLTACPAIPLGDPVCGWRVTLSAYHDADGNGQRSADEGGVYNARFVVTEVRGGKAEWPKFLGANEVGQAVYSRPGVGTCPDLVRVSVQPPAPYSLTTSRELELTVNSTTAAAWGFKQTSGPAPTPPPAAAMTCYTAPILRGALTGRMLAPNGDLWVTRIDKAEPVSVLHKGRERSMSIPGLSEARDPTIGPDGAVWVAGGTGGGVARLDGETWQRFNSQDGLPTDDAFMLEVVGNSLWTLTWEGPARFDPSTESWQTFPSLGQAFRVLDPGDGAPWFVDNAGLLKVDGADPKRVLHRTTRPMPEDVNAIDAVLIRLAEGAEVWLAGATGGESLLARYSITKDTWQPYTYETTSGALPVADFRDLTVLPDGSLFITTRTGGFRFIPDPAGGLASGTWVTYPDSDVQTSSAALQETDDPVLISQLVNVKSVEGYDRLCKVW